MSDTQQSRLGILSHHPIFYDTSSEYKAVRLISLSSCYLILSYPYLESRYGSPSMYRHIKPVTQWHCNYPTSWDLNNCFSYTQDIRTFSNSCSVRSKKSSFYYVSHIYCLDWKNANKKQLCMRGLRHPLGEIIMNEYE